MTGEHEIACQGDASLSRGQAAAEEVLSVAENASTRAFPGVRTKTKEKY